MGTNGSFDFATVAYTSAGVSLWTNRYHGPSSGDNQATAVCVDPISYNVYVTGDSARGSGVTGPPDFATIAYSSNGTPLWTNRYNETPATYAQTTAIAADANCNVYVAGSVGGMQAHFAAIAYSCSGTPLWTNLYRLALNGLDVLTGLAVGGTGNVYVTGWSVATGTDYATIGYSHTGVPLWTNRYNGPLNETSVPQAIAADRTGKVYVTGRSKGNGTGADYATVAYSAVGTPLWTNRYNGSGNSTDSAEAVAVDAVGSVYVTGSSYNSSGHFDFATIAYASSGMALWTNLYSGAANLSSAAYAVVSGGGHAVYVGGYAYDSVSQNDYATIAYSGAGLPLWTNRYNGPANGNDYMDRPSCLTVGSDGAIYVTGSSDGTGTDLDYATIKYVPVPDIRFTTIRPLYDGACQLRINAPTNVAFRLEASGDLSIWSTLTNFPPLGAALIQYRDKSAASFPRRFYRTVWSP